MNLPDSVTEIGERAFGYYCVNGFDGNYESMNMSMAGHTQTAAEVYANANSSIRFLDLDSLSGICGDTEWDLNVDTGELVISGRGAMADYVYYGQNLSPFTAYKNVITSVTVEEGVTSIGNYDFYELYRLEKVTLPESLVSIGNGAFRSCTALTSIALPRQISSIGANAFQNCQSLQSVSVPEDNELYLSEFGILYDKTQTKLLHVPAGIELETFSVPDTVTQIGDYAFSNSQNLRYTYLPSSVNYIGDYAFSECASMKALIFRGTALTLKGYNAFNTKGLTFYCSFSDTWWQNEMETLTYPEGRTWVDLDKLENVQKLQLEADAETLAVGENLQITAKLDPVFGLDFIWESSAPEVADVAVTITVANLSQTLTAQLTVTVQDREGADKEGGSVIAQGTASENISNNNYTVWTTPANSYLSEKENGTLERVEYIDDTGVIVETYSADGEYQGSRTISMEIPLFGGFFAGENYNFLVFAQENTEETDDCEIMRVVKYSKEWERLDAYSVYGANTRLPFEAGALRMAETGGKLYIHTCHQMYLSNDGLHHQANMTFVVNEADMTELQSYYDVLNISQAGYVSHSFNQFVQTDGTYVYRVDHGDSAPRAVALSRAEVAGNITDVSYTLPLRFNGIYGDNATGVSVGGFELSADNCLVVGNSVDQSDASSYSANGQRNIFLTATRKDLTSTNIIWLTDYIEEDNVIPRTPQLVKINDWQFLILWEEYNVETRNTITKMVTADGDGNLISDIISTGMRLSDCQPIAASDGMVKWYVTTGENVYIYSVNPYRLENGKKPDTCPGEHVWDNGVVIKTATCTESGERFYQCVNCNQTRTENVPAKGHSWSTWSTVPSADGTVFRTCLRCEEVQTKPYSGESETEKPQPDTQEPTKPGTKPGQTTPGTKPGTKPGQTTPGTQRPGTSPQVTEKPKLNASGKLPLQIKKSVILQVTNLVAGDAVTSWKSSNTKIVKVSKKGKVKAKKKTGTAVVKVTARGILKALSPGKAKITVKSGKAKYKITVRVS